MKILKNYTLKNGFVVHHNKNLIVFILTSIHLKMGYEIRFYLSDEKYLAKYGYLVERYSIPSFHQKSHWNFGWKTLV